MAKHSDKLDAIKVKNLRFDINGAKKRTTALTAVGCIY